ncbi:hypothetical protein A2U01_0099097, partial [Trifolium medium]|nr:hypothetical protein [Trifolium medium]
MDDTLSFVALKILTQSHCRSHTQHLKVWFRTDRRCTCTAVSFDISDNVDA